jgi:hypothetical protein
MFCITNISCTILLIKNNNGNSDIKEKTDAITIFCVLEKNNNAKE